MASHPYIPAPNVAQVEQIFEFGSTSMENVFHVLGTADWTTTLLTNLISVFQGWEADVASAQRSNQMGCTEIIATDLTTQTSPRVTSTTGLPINGQIVSNCLPLNVTWAVKAQTAKRGRSYRGRTYWIGLPISSVLNSQMGATPAANIVEALNAILGSVSTVNGGQMVVLSRRQGGAWLSTAVATPITAYAYTDLYTDSQRRRLPGHNIHH